jgi:hypothetical protein
MRMKLHISNYALLLLLVTSEAGWPQTEGRQATADIAQSATPASTTDADPALNSAHTPPWQIDNSLGLPPEAPTSFFMADIFGIQGGETDTGLTTSSGWGAYSRALAGLHFLKVKHRFETAVDYRAGDFFQDRELSPHRPLQELNATQLVLWKKGELSLADSMSNYIGGSFGSPWFGGASLYNLNAGGTGAGIPSTLGASNLFGVLSFGGIGQGEHFTNISQAEVSQFLSRRSIFSVAAGYGITNFFDRQQNFINSSQISGLVDYSYELSPKSDIGLASAYQTFIFPKNNGSVVTNLVELTYLRQVSRRLSLQMGGGPELERIRQVTIIPHGSEIEEVNHTRARNVAAFGSLVYQSRQANLDMSYSRGVTSGSGFYAGARSDVGMLSVSRPLSRAWNVDSSAGYAHLTEVGQRQLIAPTQSYQFWFAGLAVGRELSRHWNVFASYQYNSESFASTICVASGICDHVARNVAVIGLHWRTRPYRLDHGDGQDMQIHSISDRQGRSIGSLLPKNEDEGATSTTKASEEF